MAPRFILSGSLRISAGFVQGRLLRQSVLA
jgi:hypothetical protein